ncbi:MULTISPECIES: LysR family transcriptional regulator [Clostridiaceae]|uniref:LysR family transcriptional regulator n=1 Tax=Clostridium facile TaxID=2763035 RepID=A0ABR7IMP7_9CLOT|nr:MULTISPECIES: LysR family transcriptional regulator [Clostridiaceae]MBC5786415.1 LysR family transcriptional regulator [Clostridium facile]
MLDFRIDSFLAVCKYMNFTKASEELNITQPAVSQHIHYLEREYQTKLFEYKGKKLFLTPSGKLLLNAATTMKHDEIFLRKNMRQQHGEARHMVLGATLTIGEFMMPQLLSRYLQKYPTVSIDLQIANTQQLLEKIDRGEIDFALVEGYFDKREYDSRMFSKENYIAVCSPKYPFSDKEQSLEQLFNEKLILREQGSGTREILERYLESKNFSFKDFRLLLQTNNIQAIKHFVMEGQGITFLYQITVQQELLQGQLQQIYLPDFPLSHEFNVIWRKNSIFTEHYQEIFQELKQFSAGI